MDDVSTYPETLHMVQMWLDTRRMSELARALSLPLSRVDTNYLVHCALGKLFQEHAPKPFCVESHSGKTRFVRVLGYSTMPGKALQELARAFAEPMAYEICDFSRLATKPMPERFPEGVRLGFETRVCPVIRRASAGDNGKGVSWKKGQEVDVFLARAWDEPDQKLEREGVYCQWFSEILKNQGGAKPLSLELERFSLEKMTRRTRKERKAHTFTRPDITLSGKLEVHDGRQFTDLLRRGIGRQRSFGYGMIKVRRLTS